MVRVIPRVEQVALGRVRWLLGQDRWLVDVKRTDFGEESAVAEKEGDEYNYVLGTFDRRKKAFRIGNICYKHLKVMFSAHCLHYLNLQLQSEQC